MLSIGTIGDVGHIVEFFSLVSLIRDMTNAIISRIEVKGNGFYKLEQIFLFKLEFNFNYSRKQLKHKPHQIQKTILWHKRLGHLKFESFHLMF
jgi:hypothetical protein